MLVDSHCHLDRLDLEKYNGNLSKALEAAKEQGIGHILCVSVNLEDYPKVLEIAETYPDISCSVGVHPNDGEDGAVSEETLLKLADHQKVVAIGETGMDTYRTKGEALKVQEENFRTHIRVAKQTQKPLIIHSRMAPDETIRIFEEEDAKSVGGVMHCFTESWKMAQQAMDHNFYVSISGIVTFKNAEQVKEVAKKMPIERLLVETDAPWLAPVPNRGKPNEPAYVKYVAEYVAELRGMTYEALAEKTTENFFNLFKGARDV